MAIGTDSAIHFFGTQDTITNTGNSTADGVFTAAGSTWTNDDDAPMASAMLQLTFSVAPDPNSVVNLYAQLHNINSTNDQEVPSASFQHAYLGSFPVDDVTSNQRSAINISLPNAYSGQVYQFYIENQAGQTISANWVLLMTPKTIGPHT